MGRMLRLAALVSKQKLTSVRGLPPARLADTMPAQIGLYAHVPFCRSICSFCPYNKVLFDSALAARYKDAMRREIELVSPLLEGRRVTSLYIGGGTPTLLPEFVEELCQVGRNLGVQREIGVEVLPTDATPEMLARLRGAGVNFVSIGVQSFDDEVLQYLGRGHDSRTARVALDNALKVGFDCIDVDLVFDPTRFGIDRVLSDATETFKLGVHQISTYPMMRFSYTPIGNDKVHDESTEKQVLDDIEHRGRDLGYVRSSVWTYNLDRDTRYTSITREFYLGLGPSGSSFLNGMFTINSFDTAAYADMVEKGSLPVVMMSDMDQKGVTSYYLFWRMYEGIIGRERFQRLFGISVEKAFPLLMGLFVAIGGVQRRGDNYYLTRRGYDLFHTVERWVTYQFIEPTWDACRSTPHPDTLVL